MISAISSWDFGSKWSRTIRGTQKWGYKWHLSVSFSENATFVFWLCQNSWFWVWKFFLVMPFFIKITFLTMCQDHFCTRKHSNRAFEAFGFLLPPCCGYKKPTAKNTLFEWFLVQKWSWHIVSKVIFMKNVFTNIFFSDPKSAVLT